MISIVSYVLAIISIVAYVYNINDKKLISYYIWLITNILWAAYNFLKNDWGSAIMFIAYAGFCIYGIIKELKKDYGK